MLKTDDGKAGVFALRRWVCCVQLQRGQRSQGIYQTETVCWQAAIFPYHPFLPLALPLLFIPPSFFPTTYFFSSLLPYLSLFPLPLSFSISQCLFSISFYPWICFSSLSRLFFFFFSAFLSVFFILPRAPSICFPLSQPPVMGQPPGLAQRWDKREGQDSFCAFLRLKVSWQGQIEKQPTC